MRLFCLLILSACLAGCSAGKGLGDLFSGIFGGGAPEVGSSDPLAQSTANALWPLTAVGGICCITGAVMLIVTRFSRGWGPLMLGAGLAILNALVLRFLGSTLFWVAAGLTGLVSLWVAYRNGKILTNGEIHWKFWQRPQSQSTVQHPSSSSEPVASSPP